MFIIMDFRLTIFYFINIFYATKFHFTISDYNINCTIITLNETMINLQFLKFNCVHFPCQKGLNREPSGCFRERLGNSGIYVRSYKIKNSPTKHKWRHSKLPSSEMLSGNHVPLIHLLEIFNGECPVSRSYMIYSEIEIWSQIE